MKLHRALQNSKFTIPHSTRALASLILATFLPLALAMAQNPSEIVEISVDCSQPTGSLNPIWNWFGYDEANYTYHPDGIELLSRIGELQPEPAYIRCHHLLTTGIGEAWLKWSSTNAYTESADGSPVYDWTLVNRIFDTYLELGLKPFVEIAFMPEALSAQPDPYTPRKILHEEPTGMVTGGAFHPPADYAKWSRFMEAFFQHCKDRYGEDEVNAWYWELWNEPNGGYWKGTPEEFFALYDYTAAAFKKILPDAPFGGPHITNPDYREGGVFLDRFLQHCLEGRNAATGEKGTPLDFIAFHAKGGTSWEEDHVQMNLGNHLVQIGKSLAIVAKYPELSDKPIIIGESDPDGCAACTARLYPKNAYRNSSQYAAYIAALFSRKQDLAATYDLDLIGAVTWAFAFPDQPYFDGFRTLSTNGVPKPVFNAFRAFGKLGSERLEIASSHARSLEDLAASSVRDQPDIHILATRHSESEYAILAWHYHDDGRPGPSRQLAVKLDNLPPGQYALRRYRVDDSTSNAHTAWLAMGSPQSPSDQQRQALLKSSELTLIAEDEFLHVSAKPSHAVQLELPRHSVELIELAKK